jgi:methylornithine synthase
MEWTESRLDFDSVLAKAQRGGTLSREEVASLLSVRDEDRLETLFRTARELRRRYFGRSIFLSGFLYLSTHCRNDCSFCLYRKSNRASPRYRKTQAEVVEAACKLAASEVDLIDLTMGEDSVYVGRGGGHFDRLVGLVDSIRHTTGLPIMVSAGVLSARVLSELKAAGATWYACYQETHNRALYERLRPGQSYDLRMDGKIQAHDLGILIEEGVLSGVGESIEDVADSISAMRALDADQVRAMSFVPQTGTPMADWPSPNRRRELISMATMRIVFPDRLIPASLDVDGLAGLKLRLEAGANVITSIVPANLAFAGVARSSLDIDNSNRSAPSVVAALEACGLKKAGPDQYRLWIEDRKKRLV